MGKAQRDMSRKKKKQGGFHYFIYRYFFILSAVKSLRFRSRFLFFCIRSPEDWRSNDFRVGKKFAFIFCGQKVFGMHVIKPG